MMKLTTAIKLGSLLLLAALASGAHAQMDHGKRMAAKAELGTAAALDPQGRLWIASKEQAAGSPAQYVVLQSSPDMGASWSAPRRIQQEPEAVAADGESRPKLAFGSQGQIYIAYTKPLGKPYTGEIRFVRSLDGGQTFSAPVTVHRNRDEITHRFESMIVDREGRIHIAWIDKRDIELAKARKQAYRGAAIYYAVSDDAGASFKGDYKAADHSCECCRIAMALTPQGKAVAMWRHVFEPNVRDHALRELTPDGAPPPLQRASFDDWHIDACPHHGPALAFGADGKRHQTWFGVRGEAGGVFYGVADADGKLGQVQQLGSAQAEHADVLVDGKTITLVWKQFDGKATAIWGRRSTDNGLNWTSGVLASSRGNSDQPHLLATPAGAFLLWRTQDEGVRILPAIPATSATGTLP
ncbi:sialidase family protein [Rugamonas rubra]|nr:sialidase family protein [Rugamonas rubra]